jgi:hypothetical protein
LKEIEDKIGFIKELIKLKINELTNKKENNEIFSYMFLVKDKRIENNLETLQKLELEYLINLLKDFEESKNTINDTFSEEYRMLLDKINFIKELVYQKMNELMNKGEINEIFLNNLDLYFKYINIELQRISSIM